MEEKKKKNRSANFSKTEVDLLCNLIIKYAPILESKKTDAVMWQQKMDNWNKLTSDFNRQNGGLPRTMLSLKTKYECIKKEIRKKAAKAKQELYKTGGGPSKGPPLTSSEEKIYNLIFLSVEGLPSRHDDDNGIETQNYYEDNEIKIRENENNSSENEIEIIYLHDGECNDQELSRPSQSFSHEESKVEGTSEGNRTELSVQINEKDKNWKKWDPLTLKTPTSKQLQAKRKKNLLTKLEASEKVNIVAQSKKELVELQTKCLEKEMKFKEIEYELKIKKLEEELKIAELDLEIKQLEKEIKVQTLKRLLNNPL